MIKLDINSFVWGSACLGHAVLIQASVWGDRIRDTSCELTPCSEGLLCFPGAQDPQGTVLSITSGGLGCFTLGYK